MTYNDNFVPERRQNEERMSKILRAVKENHTIHHNALKKIVVEENKDMAKRTFDKLTKEMRKNGLLIIIPFEDNKIHYSIPQTIRENINFEKDFEFYLKSFENKIKHLKQEYKKYPVEGKQGMMISLLANIFSGLVGITMMRSVLDPKISSLTKQEIKLRQYVKNCINIIMQDKDANVVILVVNDSILNSFQTTQFLQLLKAHQT